jgi:hypothetical protein
VSDESTRVGQWLYETLKADATLTALIGGSTDPRIFDTVAPAGSTYPLVTFGLQASTDVIGATENTRIMTNSVWTVVGWAETLTFVGVLQDIADRIDAVLHASAGGTADSATIFTAHRIQSLRLIEERDGRQFRRLGGLFRVFAQR